MTEPHCHGKRILVVDDGMTTRLYYRSVFETAGFVVEEAANGLEGLERALVEPFDLLVVDVNMPKMDGYTLIERLRGDAAGQAVPIVTISTEAGTSVLWLGPQTMRTRCGTTSPTNAMIPVNATPAETSSATSTMTT